MKRGRVRSTLTGAGGRCCARPWSTSRVPWGGGTPKTLTLVEGTGAG